MSRRTSISVVIFSCLVLLAAFQFVGVRGEEGKKLKPRLEGSVHNYQSRAWKHWSVAFWTDGKVFWHGVPIGVELRFYADNGNFTGRKLTATFTLIDKKSKESVGSNKIELELEKVASDFSIYGISIENITPNKENPRFSVRYETGRYNLQCEIHLDDSKIATFEDAWISVEERNRPPERKK